MNQYLDGSVEWNRNAIDRYMTTLETVITRTLHDFSQLEKRFLFRMESFVQESAHIQIRVQGYEDRLNISVDRSFAGVMQSLEGFSKSLLHLGPGEVLKRGYSIVRRKGAPITSAESLKVGDTIDITFRDGTRQAKTLGNQQSLL